MKQAILAIILVLAGVAAAVVLVRTKAPPVPRPVADQRPMVRTAQAEPARLAPVVSGVATVEAAARLTVAAEVAGRLAEVPDGVRSGARLAAGALLARIDDAELRLAVRRRGAELAQARAELLAEQARGEVARDDLARAGARDAGPLARREPQLAAAQAAVDAAAASLAQAELDLARCAIAVPWDALVVRRLAEPGMLVARGSGVCEIVAGDRVEVRWPVGESDAARLGAATAIRVRAGTAEAAGRLLRIDAERDPRTRQAFAVVEVRAPGFAPGQLATVEAALPADPGLVEVPAAAVAGGRVWLVEDGRLRAAAVQVLRIHDGSALVGGIAAGAQAVVSPLDAPLPGVAVRVAEPAP